MEQAKETNHKNTTYANRGSKRENMHYIGQTEETTETITYANEKEGALLAAADANRGEQNRRSSQRNRTQQRKPAAAEAAQKQPAEKGAACETSSSGGGT